MNEQVNTSSSSVNMTGSAIHWSSVIQLGFSLLGTLSLWGVAATLFLGGFLQLVSQGSSSDAVLQYFLLAGGAALCGTLLLPGSIHAFRRLAGHPPRPIVSFPSWLRPTLLIFLLPLLLLFGHWVNQQDQIAWLILPIVHGLSIGLPILWFVYLAIRNLSAGSPQRQWGVFSTGLVLAPVLSFFIEIFVILFLILAWSAWATTQPDLLRDLTNLAQRLEQARVSPEEVLRILEPYIASPVVLFAILSVFSVLVPLIEETIKPLGVWMLANRNLSPAQGFAAGVLSGAGFALAESLALSSTGEDWALAVFTRIGTGALHILASGLVGWGLARAWGERKFLQLAATYLLAVFLHSIWNTLSILLAMSYLPEILTDLDLIQLPDIQGEIIPYLLVLLAFTAFLSLLGINRGLKHRDDDHFIPQDVV